MTNSRLVVLLLFISTILLSNNSVFINARSPTVQTRLEITVHDIMVENPYRWTVTCNPTGGSHPDPQAVCNEIEKLHVPLNEVIQNANANGPCNRMYRPTKLSITGVVNYEEIIVVAVEYANPCILRYTLIDAGLSSLVPLDESGSLYKATSI